MLRRVFLLAVPAVLLSACLPSGGGKPSFAATLKEALSATGNEAQRAGKIIKLWDDVSDCDTSVFADANVTDSILQIYFSQLALLQKARRDSALLSCARAWGGAPFVLQALDASRERLLNGASVPDSLSLLHADMLAALLRQKTGNAHQRKRWAEERRLILQNGVGDEAADFVFTDASGRPYRLKTFFKGRGGILYFFDPECEECDAALAVLESQADALFSGVPILAVYAGGDGQVWRAFLRRRPNRRVVWATDGGAVFKGALYNLRRLPSFYVIDGDGRVRLRDGRVEDVLAWFSRHAAR